jgi:putative ABC transport system permease protein
VLVVNLDMRGAATPMAARQAINEQMVARVRAVSGVDDAAEAFIVPVSGSGWNQNIVIDGKTYSDRDSIVNFNRIGPGYFRTMGTPLLAGRDITASDTLNAAPVAVVTEKFAAKFFGGGNPVGRTFQIEEGVGVERPLYQIVGLAKDAKYANLREEFTPIAFLSSAQDREPNLFLQMVVRSSAPLASVTGSLSTVIAAAAPSAILQFQTLNTMVRDSLMRERLMATLSGFFGLLAGVLATIGLYGVMSYMVERRRNEIGIRIALGADRNSVIGMIMREAGALVGAGLIVGGLAAIAASKMAKTLLFGLKPGDPMTLAMAAIALTLVAGVASYVPAWRASRMEPTQALREE